MFTIREAAEMLGVATSTLRRWENEGKIKSVRTTGNHRRYTVEELSKIKKVKPLNEKITVGYCRVSSSDQREDLKRQVELVSMYCTAKGYGFEIIEDLGSGLNYNKKGLTKLIKMIQSNQVERVVINYRDRLIRFGMELIEQICEFHDVKIEVINQTEDKTYEQEMVEDILSILTVFSSRLYGSRSHKSKKLKQMVEEVIKE
ncbi:IS607 family transposase [Bacillus tuaregi]|uniref:IS607 family transposase n=1 Tax=Bacillus tuaregi TaxID=1816695 RepID=UPI0008F82784|nr:IS607 family transposase [Bacillus tuaregi]